MQLFNSMSSPSFLLVNETNHNLLRALLEAMNSILEHQYKSKCEAPPRLEWPLLTRFRKSLVCRRNNAK